VRSRARVVHGITALTVLVGLVVQAYASYHAGEGARFTHPWERVANMGAYFTIWSNVIVGVTTAALALRPGLAGTALTTLRLVGLVGITITGVVYHAVLKQLFDFSGAAKAADQLLHSYVPVLALAGWLLAGPHGRLGPRHARLALWFVALWGTITLVRGAVIDWYPYPFVDVVTHGYARVAVNSAGVALLYSLVALAYVGLDRRLSARARTRAAVAG
jgi:hypothetical protein